MKHLVVSFKIYADFESVLKGVKKFFRENASYTNTHQKHIPCSFSCKVVCIEIDLASQLFFTEEKMQSKQFITAVLKENEYCQKFMKIKLNLKLN